MAEKPLPVPADIAALPFEEAMAELEAIVRQLEAGQVKLDAAMAAYDRGSQLKLHCATLLKAAEAKLERITQGADGALTTQPAEIG